MRKIVVTENISLDGVMQAPAMPDEDLRDGFPHGGWANRYFDQVMADYMTADADQEGCLLLGRRTYEGMAANWPHMPADNPFTQWINAMPKFVASGTLTGPLDWNATLLDGDLGEAVRELKAGEGPDLTVLGSGVLVRSLREHGLIDEYLLSIHPLLLGTGVRLFPDGAAADLELVDSVTTTTGVLIARLRRVG
ncbi:deaminase [Amycolatopsis antarctica]|uniref:Deaminase n=1 Tax=Amycolatopsis antarctica TaxID=1854586 RepID=A0A263D3I2_9PSEU|nr:dihydrofolate reductase family protein [Amycolatopsis antarctica]OZM72006.1 deaminase [Amycolatopsis antarctica]